MADRVEPGWPAVDLCKFNIRYDTRDYRIRSFKGFFDNSVVIQLG